MNETKSNIETVARALCEQQLLAMAISDKDAAAGVDRYWHCVAADIEAVVRAVPDLPVKLILETAALTEAEKRLACRLACDAGARFVKTSTGFHPSGGATVDDVRLLRAAVGPDFGVKASGGIRNLADAQAMIGAGANRLGTSASAAILGAIGAAESARS